MNILHWMKTEDSGLFRTTFELVEEEERQGHNAAIREPTGGTAIHGTMTNADVELVHSQLPITSYYNGKVRAMVMHGEPLSSVGNKVSMKAIIDLAPMVDAFICMRKDEHIIWNSIKRTYLVTKGINLKRYYPIEGVTQRLSGEPAVVYYENWRGQRNPLYAVIAMREVWKKYPSARLHLYNCRDKKLTETFKALIKQAKLWPFVRTLSGPVKDVNLLLNRCDIVVSCLYPLYARSIEAFGAGKALICPGYRVPEYPWVCQLDPVNMAEVIIRCWENYDRMDYRQWAVDKHNVADTVKECIAIYERYLD